MWAAAGWNSGGLKYSPRVWEKTDPYHRFPQSFGGVIIKKGSSVVRGDYVQYELPGSVNGQSGVYQIGVENGVVTHRFFKPD